MSTLPNSSLLIRPAFASTTSLNPPELAVVAMDFTLGREDVPQHIAPVVAGRFLVEWESSLRDMGCQEMFATALTTIKVWAEEIQSSERLLTHLVGPTTIAPNNQLGRLEPGIFAWTI